MEEPISPDKGSDLDIMMQYHREQAKPGTAVYDFFHSCKKDKQCSKKDGHTGKCNQQRVVRKNDADTTDDADDNNDDADDTDSGNDDDFVESKKCGRNLGCVKFARHRGKCKIR